MSATKAKQVAEILKDISAFFVKAKRSFKAAFFVA